MAYELYYTANFDNKLSQRVNISIYKKDAAPPATVENYEVIKCETTDSGETQTKYNTIIIREITLSLKTTDALSITWETFISSEHDTWKIDVTVEDISAKYYFDGYIIPDEGNSVFQDKPYVVTLRATNGLALLKNIPLSNVFDADFDGDHPLIDYIAGALHKTGLGLGIRIYCGYFHFSMLHKGNALTWDMFQQTYVNYRTFQNSPTTFISCYDALKIILYGFTLEYSAGAWVIASIAEKQYIPVNRYHVDYDSTGSVIGALQDTHNYGMIGKAVDIFPINETQTISSKTGVASVRTPYMYVVWLELPKNNKFERGTEFETGVALDEDDIDNDGDTSEVVGTYKKFSINDWQYGKFTSVNVVLPFVPNAELAYRKSVYNSSNVEIERKIVLENTTGTNNYLITEPIPVYSQDKIKFGFDFKHTAGGVDFGTQFLCRVYLYPTGNTTDPLWLDNDGMWKSTTTQSMSHFYDNGEDSSKFMTFSFEPNFIPQDGTLYIMFVHTGTSGDRVYRNFSFEYLPFVAGGYIQVKGDYIFRSQSANFQQVIDEEVFISDSPKKILKGALLFNNQLTDPAWYRFGEIGDPNITGDQRHYKDLINLGRFNHHYRRMYALSGDFKGFSFGPENDQLNKRPINFYWVYREVDMTEPRDFVFVPPLKMDLITGWINANLVEVKKDNNDGTQEGTAEFKHIF